MAKVKKEPKEYYKEFKVYEKCKFCRKETNTWHEKTQTPLCEECAKDLKDEDI